MYDLWVYSNSKKFFPPIEEGITWETSRVGEPSKLKFKCIADYADMFTEGDAVSFKKDNVGVFIGYVFKKSRTKDRLVEVTCYDQLRYFKNKDTYVYTNKTASQVLTMLARDFGLSVGKIENTGYVIPNRVEDNKSLFDIMQNALNETLTARTQLYCLYDNYGLIELRNIENLKTNILIDAETGQNYTYESSIDDQTYNQIKLTYDNEQTGKREVYMARDSKSISRWGVLQLYESVSDPLGAIDKVNKLLQLYNAKTRNLKIEKAFGHVACRAGASVVVRLNLGDVSLSNYMLIEKATHEFNNDLHTMTLTLRGGEFIA